MQWACQDIVLRIVTALKRKGYLVWVDVEQIFGSILDRMSDAIENAEVVLFGVSQLYKESANCKSREQREHARHQRFVPARCECVWCVCVRVTGRLELSYATQVRSKFEFSLCLSRACLGKIIVLLCKWRKKWRFRTDHPPTPFFPMLASPRKEPMSNVEL